MILSIVQVAPFIVPVLLPITSLSVEPRPSSKSQVDTILVPDATCPLYKASIPVASNASLYTFAFFISPSYANVPSALNAPINASLEIVSRPVYVPVATATLFT